jgi:anti-sigma factor RsiW
MTPEERDQLIQRYYDGETIGNEAAQVEQLLESDPEARGVLESLRTLSDEIKTDLAHALAGEDFDSYWGAIEDRLEPAPEGPAAGPDLVVAPAEPLRHGRGGWLRWLFHPGLAAGLAAAIAIAVFLPMSPEEVPVSYAIEIEEIDSAGPMVMVHQESDDLPAIVWFVEADST